LLYEFVFCTGRAGDDFTIFKAMPLEEISLCNTTTIASCNIRNGDLLLVDKERTSDVTNFLLTNLSESNVSQWQ